MELADLTIVCRQCGKEFLFSTAEQEYYQDKGFEVPHHCKSCRADRRNKVATVCSKCGNKVENNTAIYCGACYASLKLSAELDTGALKNSLSENEVKLSAVQAEKNQISEFMDARAAALEAEKSQLTRRLQDIEAEAKAALNTAEMKSAELAASNTELQKLLQEEKRITASLQDQLRHISTEMEKSNKYRVDLDSIGPGFKMLVEHLSVLEQSQNSLNETVRQMIQIQKERENAGPFVFIKRIFHLDNNHNNHNDNTREIRA